jgi:hypothetical protein
MILPPRIKRHREAVFLSKDGEEAQSFGIADTRDSLLATRTSQVYPPGCARQPE